MILKIIVSLLVFMLVVVVHEYGHFYFAKRAKVKVNEFAVGMGPKLISKQKGETLYSVRALPLGGFCSMEGEDEANPEGTFEETGDFNKAPIWGRIFTIFGGPLFNFILAFVILICLFGFRGIQTTEIDSVLDNSAAQKVGIMKGDTIVKIGDSKVSDFKDVVQILGALEENETTVVYTRDNVEYEVKVNFENSESKLLGVKPKLKRSVGLALKEAFNTFYYFISSMFGILKQLFTGKVGVGQLSGPIGVVGAISNATSNGIFPLLYMTAFLSVNLGFLNLLPIPALDGGRLVFLFIELILGRPISREKEGYVHFVGFVFLMGLILYVSFKDILRLNLF